MVGYKGQLHLPRTGCRRPYRARNQRAHLAISFSDGTLIGAVLDRNGLRPSRYTVTKDGLVIMASETGVLPIPEKCIVEKWRLQPGKMFLIDTAQQGGGDAQQIQVVANWFDELKRLAPRNIDVSDLRPAAGVATAARRRAHETLLDGARKPAALT